MAGEQNHVSPSTSSAQDTSRKGRFGNRKLRRASFISPITGQRSERVFTLREASSRHSEDRIGETTPLLNAHHEPRGFPDLPSKRTLLQSYWACSEQYVHQTWEFATSKTGIGIFKCSLAYLIGSLATFVPAISNMIGQKQDSKHMVATVTVYFHPARSMGSMHEATFLAIIALCYSGLVSFTSMGVSMFFGQQDLLLVGHAIVLIFFVGGGLGFIAWIKQRLGDPLVNVACSLASLGCITVLIKEGAVQAGEFSDDRVLQVLLMVCMGAIATTAVNVLVLPITARASLVKDMERNTDLLGEMLISITRAFLSGRERDLQDESYKKLTKDHQSSLDSMHKNVREAKRELLVLGKERWYDAEARMVECLTGLAQDLGGLRSAALAQFAFMNENDEVTPGAEPLSTVRSKPTPKILDVITEAPEDAGEMLRANGHDTPTTAMTYSRRESIDPPIVVKTPNDFFLAFLDELAPPTRSLVYTLKQILDELPFRRRDPARSTWWKRLEGIDVEVAVNDTFHSSLKEAMHLYRHARKDALNKLYESRAISAATTPQQWGKSSVHKRSTSETVSTAPQSRLSSSGQSTPCQQPPPMNMEDAIADIEEVSACCGHFSFSLLDFAEGVLDYLAALDQLKAEMERPKYSWSWLFPWKNWHEHGDVAMKPTRKRTFNDENDEATDLSNAIPARIQQADDFARASGKPMPWTYRLYHAMAILRRDDVRFAIKVGLGALLYALPAFLPETRPFFVHWRGEWGLVSFMVVCSMTVGAANTTSVNRFFGSFVGAALAVAGWLLASHHGEANPYLLAVFGWLVSLGCFYMIIAKNNGPMGRFILLTYNLGALYSYSLSIQDDDNDDDEGGIDPAIWDIVLHRLVSVIVGCIWAIIVTRFIWPISARRKLNDGLCILWLRMSLVWKRDPLALFLLGEPKSRYMDIREESALQTFLSNLEGLRKAAKSEFELRGPFPDAIVGRILDRTGRMLDAFHAMNVVITKNLHYTPGEAALIRFTRPERSDLSARISHLFSVLASSLKLQYPLNDVLPSIDHTRDRLLSKMSAFRREGVGRDAAVVVEQDYEMLYAYVLVTGQLSQDIQAISAEIETLYGTLNEDNFKLQ
ncbi:hypothetical protein EJ03DRAFT_330027 [Teratosphaeria nubilosa]|uniref:Integral membrane bound transporter domain-containing protein n=1 Tax=Teratosphaeria nubilosa TaxID=161662 RepID=A0A6G1L0W3_9PEZI|nr:hypothetical protein EJ03DRAFT_330027 [Teratosphaeria nubilosa]